MLHYSKLVWAEMSEAEKMIVFNEWKEYKKRKEEQSLRNARRRQEINAKVKWAEENGYGEEVE